MSTITQRAETAVPVQVGRARRLKPGGGAGVWLARLVLVVLCFVAVLPALAGITGQSYLHASQLASGFRTALFIAAASCGGAPLSIIRQYIEQQNRPG